MLSVAGFDEVQVRLARASHLIDLMEGGEGRFVDEVKVWCSDLEMFLRTNKIAEAGTVASLRGTLISAERGGLPQDLRLVGQATKRKAKQVTAAAVVRGVVSVLSEAVRGDKARIDDAERIVAQLIAIAKAKGVIGSADLVGERALPMAELWSKMTRNSEISAGTANVEGLVGSNDALVILNRVVSRQFSTPG